MPNPAITYPIGVNPAPLAGNLVYTSKDLLQIASDPASNTSTVTGASTASPSVITTSAAHGLISGQSVSITGIVGTGAAFPSGNGGPAGAKNQFTVTVLSATTFSIGVAYAGTWTSGGTVVGAFQIGQVVAYQSWNGLVSGAASAPSYPTVGLEPTTANALIAGVIAGGSQVGKTPLVGGVLTLVVAGLAQVYMDATTTVGGVVIPSAAHPGQGKTGTAVVAQNLGVCLQVVTVSGAVGQLAWCNIAPS